MESGKWKQVVKVEARAVPGDAAGRKSMDKSGMLALSKHGLLIYGYR